jgi:hypothetical protein
VGVSVGVSVTGLMLALRDDSSPMRILPELVDIRPENYCCFGVAINPCVTLLLSVHSPTTPVPRLFPD